MNRSILTAVGAAGLLVALIAPTAVAKAGVLPSDLQAVRAAVAKYHSYDRALADGYSALGEPCVAEPGVGTMGIHAVNVSLVRSGANDPERPPILLYVPRDDGSLRLVGVEYFAVALANTEAGPAPWFYSSPPPLGFFNPAPRLFGHTFDGPMAGHNPSMPWHYDLHVWVIEANPAGLFAPLNPSISC
jgi:hypothetical protein